MRAILTTRGRMSSPRALPLVCELRASPDLRARPVCVAASRESDHVVLGYENGAVAAWRAADFPLPEEASRVLSSGAVAARPSWVVAELEGSGGDGCPVDALALLPACLALYHDHLEHQVPLSTVKVKGRWKSDKSFMRYSKPAVSETSPSQAARESGDRR